MVRHKIKLAFVTGFFLCLASSQMPSVRAQGVTAVADLWLDISLGPPLVRWFNEVADADDIARVENFSDVDLLEQITVGRKLVVFRSVSEAESMIPSIADQIDIVGYNLEQNSASPLDEQADPVVSARRMRALADAYGLALAFGPDHFFALNRGVEIAPFVDIFVLQVQRVQTEPDTVHDFVLPLVPQLLEANPDLEISVQVRTEGDVVEIVDLVDSIKGSLDGVSILTSPDTVSVAQALVEELQTRTFDNQLLGIAATETAAASLADPITRNGPAQAGPFSWSLIILVALLAGTIAGGIVAFVMISSRNSYYDQF